jgi:filamentous hemagglutinin family protein
VWPILSTSFANAMNRSYRLVWNEKSQRHVPAPEVAGCHGRGGSKAAAQILVVALGLSATASSWGVTPLPTTLPTALPTGGQVVAGQATLNPVAAAASLVVNQSSPRTIIQWNSFNIGAQASVTFVQPDSSSVALNRVMGAEPSQIFGQLKANGQVFLINPNGVLFAPGAQVNVHGLLATTMDTPDADFMAGTPHFAGKAGSVRNEGTIHADAGGFISLLGGLVTNTGEMAVINTQGILPAQGLVMRDGGIELVGDVVHQAGTLDASGLNGGLVNLSGRSVLQDGFIQANGSQGAGGQVHISASSTLLQTQAAQISADGTTTGGQISLSSGQTAYLSGTNQANGGQSGGQIDIQTTGLLSVAGAHLSAMGEAGRIVLMSQADTRFAATATTGPKGFIEISGKGTLYMGGRADPGLGGQTLLDPTNIVIGPASTTLSYIDLANPNPAAADQHGSGGTVEVGGGNIVVASPNDNFGGVGSTGAVYLYNGTTGALISTLFGTVAGDLVGSGGVTKLSNGNYTVNSPSWNGGLGAVSWGNDTTGLNGAVSGTNSLVGSAAGDQVGLGGVTALNNGNYVVSSPLWNASIGAVTWAPGGGLTGPITGANSLLGRVAGDSVGSGGITALPNGNYVISSPLWNTSVGAVTWANGATGLMGTTVRAGNSLIGAAAGDSVGSGGVTALTNGNYVVNSPTWNASTGATTWMSGTTPSTGTVSPTNSLIGAAPGDSVGSSGVTALTNGNYVVNSPTWGGGLGAVTWMSGLATNPATVSPANSLIGAAAGDQIGLGGVTALSNGNYAVSSPTWAGNLGAVTWMNGLIASSGTVSAANSLVGTTPGDQVGFGGVTALTNGNYVVNSPLWSANTGAITWMDGLGNSTPSAVSALNSLIGAVPGDSIGSGMDGLGRGGITALTNGNYVVNSPLWGGTLGAVTWMSGTIPSLGTVSAANSLIGNVAGDLLGIGGIAALTNGNYAISSPMWSNGAITNTGAVSLGDGTLGSVGTVGSTPSLMGTLANDNLGWDGLIPLSTGGFVILSSNYAGGFGAAWVVTATTGLMPDYTPAQLAAMAPLGSTLTLAATNAITVNAPVVVDGALTLNAGNTLTLNASITSNAASTSALVMVAGQSFVNNVGANALSTPNGNWQVWSANPAMDTRGGLVYGFKQYNATYGLTTPAQATGNGLFYSLAPLLSPSVSGAALKTYDGNTTAPLTNLLLSATGAVDGDVIALSALSANYATPAPNAANNLDVTASGISATASNGLAPVYGYQMASTTATGLGIGQINPMPLTVNGTTAANKVYDATATAILTGGTLLGTVAGTGVLPGDILVLQQSGSFLDKNVGTNKPVSIINTLSGASAGNYVLNTLTQATTAAITPATLNVNGTVVAPKIYDASLAATIGTPGTLATVLGTDQVALSQSALFTNKNVNTAQIATVINSLSGLDAGNYVLANPSINTTAAITPATLTVNGTVVAPKVYDASLAATIGTPGTLATLLGTDQVALSQSALFSNKNVNTAQIATVINSLSGLDAGNYVLANPSINTTAAITPATLTVNGTVVAPKVYDASLAATIGTPGTLATVLGTDQVALSQSALFTNKNVNTAQIATVINSLSGLDAGNYVLATPTLNTTAAITPATLTVNGTVVAPKIYDASLAAAIGTPGTLATLLGTDQVLLGQTALFTNKNVNTAQSVTVSNTLSGLDASNYILANPNINTTAAITPALLNVSGTAIANKVYDAGVQAPISTPGTLSTVLGNDLVFLGQSAQFSTKNVGSAKPVTVTNTLSGPDAGNYVLNTPSVGSTANITPAVLTLSGTLVANKTYDATLAASISTAGILGGVLVNDGVSVTQWAAFGDKNAGQGKPVTVNSTLTGPDASNYVLSTPSLSTTATITPATLNVSGTVVAGKVYDASLTAVIATTGTLAPVFANDQVGLNQSALFLDKNVGTTKAVTVTNTLTGLDAGNYVLSTPTLSTTATITPATLNVSGIRVSPKVFDGTLTAVVSSTLGNVQPNDQVGLNQVASFADPNTGNAKPVNIVNSLTGPDAGNYVLNTLTQVSTGNIVPPNITPPITLPTSTTDSVISLFVTGPSGIASWSGNTTPISPGVLPSTPAPISIDPTPAITMVKAIPVTQPVQAKIQPHGDMALQQQDPPLPAADIKVAEPIPAPVRKTPVVPLAAPSEPPIEAPNADATEPPPALSGITPEQQAQAEETERKMRTEKQAHVVAKSAAENTSVSNATAAMNKVPMGGSKGDWEFLRPWNARRRRAKEEKERAAKAAKAQR